MLICYLHISSALYDSASKVTQCHICDEAIRSVKGREYRHTEPGNRTDKTEPAGGQGADRSLTET